MNLITIGLQYVILNHHNLTETSVWYEQFMNNPLFMNSSWTKSVHEQGCSWTVFMNTSYVLCSILVVHEQKVFMNKVVHEQVFMNMNNYVTIILYAFCIIKLFKNMNKNVTKSLYVFCIIKLFSNMTKYVLKGL